MNEELIERFNAEIQTIEQLTTNTIQQQKEIYQQKQEKREKMFPKIDMVK